MCATATLIELINKSNVTPDEAHSFFTKLANQRRNLFKNKYFILILRSEPKLSVCSRKVFPSHDKVEHYLNVTGNMPEYLFVTTKGSTLIIALRTDTISFVHHFEKDRDYTDFITDSRTEPIVPLEEARKQLFEFFDNPLKFINIKRSVS